MQEDEDDHKYEYVQDPVYSRRLITFSNNNTMQNPFTEPGENIELFAESYHLDIPPALPDTDPPSRPRNCFLQQVSEQGRSSRTARSISSLSVLEKNKIRTLIILVVVLVAVSILAASIVVIVKQHEQRPHSTSSSQKDFERISGYKVEEFQEMEFKRRFVKSHFSRYFVLIKTTTAFSVAGEDFKSKYHTLVTDETGKVEVKQGCYRPNEAKLKKENGKAYKYLVSKQNITIGDMQKDSRNMLERMKSAANKEEQKVIGDMRTEFDVTKLDTGTVYSERCKYPNPEDIKPIRALSRI